MTAFLQGNIMLKNLIDNKIKPDIYKDDYFYNILRQEVYKMIL